MAVQRRFHPSPRFRHHQGSWPPDLPRPSFANSICGKNIRTLKLVEEFIAEVEGPPKNSDVSRWGQFTDIKDIKKEMFQRLEIQFENWLNS
jgi:hypothetical protein